MNNQDTQGELIIEEHTERDESQPKIAASLDQAMKPFPCKHYEIHSRNPGNGTDKDDCQVCRTNARLREIIGD